MYNLINPNDAGTFKHFVPLTKAEKLKICLISNFVSCRDGVLYVTASSFYSIDYRHYHQTASVLML